MTFTPVLQVLAGAGVTFLIIVVMVWYWSSRPLPAKLEDLKDI